MCPNERMTGMANLIIELVCAWLNLTGYLSVVKVESQRLFTFKKKERKKERKGRMKETK
jgi:hypothetical protein